MNEIIMTSLIFLHLNFSLKNLGGKILVKNRKNYKIKVMPNFKKIILLIGDIAILYFSLWLSLSIRYSQFCTSEKWNLHFFPFSLIYALWIIVFYIAGLYELNLARNSVEFYSTLSKAIAINGVLGIAFFYFIPYFSITPKTNLFLDIGISTGLIVLWRQIYNKIIKSSLLLVNVLFIGKSKEMEEVSKVLANNPQLGYKIVSQIYPDKLETPLDLMEIISSKRVNLIVTSIDPHYDSNLVKSLYQCLPFKISFSDSVSFYEKIMGKVPLSAIGEVWFLENLAESEKKFYENFKRIFDMFFAIIFGIISLFFYPIIAVAIKIDSKGHVFYKQKRVGLNGEVFTVYKFRTMTEDAEKNGAKWADDEDKRITKVGRFLRKTRLDELPQLLNIFFGNMSFVGPRPERVEFVEKLEKQIPYYNIRHIVRPGLTGWAQVNFRYGASVEDSIEKLQYELYYIKHRCFILDISIILKTVKIILKGAGR